MRSERGFTLIEILVGVAIIGIISGVALPVFLSANARSNLWVGSERVGATIRQTRLLAITQNNSYRLTFACPSAGLMRQLIVTGDPAVDDAAGRCSQTLDGDGAPVAMPTGISYTTSSATAMNITGRGVFTATGAAIPLTITVTNGTSTRSLTVSATGQITFSTIQ